MNTLQTYGILLFGCLIVTGSASSADQPAPNIGPSDRTRLRVSPSALDPEEALVEVIVERTVSAEDMLVAYEAKLRWNADELHFIGMQDGASANDPQVQVKEGLLSFHAFGVHWASDDTLSLAKARFEAVGEASLDAELKLELTVFRQFLSATHILTLQSSGANVKTSKANQDSVP